MNRRVNLAEFIPSKDDSANGILANSKPRTRGIQVMTVAEAADVLGVSTQTIYNYIYSGKLRARRPAERYILRERDVAALAAKRKARR